jgi:hypothetical protein
MIGDNTLAEWVIASQDNVPAVLPFDRDPSFCKAAAQSRPGACSHGYYFGVKVVLRNR